MYLCGLRRAYPERGGSAVPGQGPSRSFSNSEARQPRHDDYRSLSNRAASSNQARSGAGRDHDYGNSSLPQAGLGVSDRSSLDNNGRLKSRDDDNCYGYDGRRKRFRSSSGYEARGPRHDAYRASSNRPVNASGSHQAIFGEGRNRNYGNSSSFFSSPPQAGLDASDVPRSQNSDGVKSRGRHDGQRNKHYRR